MGVLVIDLAFVEGYRAASEQHASKGVGLHPDAVVRALGELVAAGSTIPLLSASEVVELVNRTHVVENRRPIPEEPWQARERQQEGATS